MAENQVKKKGFWKRFSEELFSKDTTVLVARSAIVGGVTAGVVSAAKYGISRYSSSRARGKLYSIKTKAGS